MILNLSYSFSISPKKAIFAPVKKDILWIGRWNIWNNRFRIDGGKIFGITNVALGRAAMVSALIE